MKYAQVTDDTVNNFLSHLSGDEVALVMKRDAVDFLSHLSGDEDKDVTAVLRGLFSKSPER